jgi:hypothetical protein
LIYLLKAGYVKVTDNMTPVPSDWVAKVYYTKNGNNDAYLKNGDGRKLCISFNPRIDQFHARKYAFLIHEEIKEMDSLTQELRKIYPNIEKMLSNGKRSIVVA